jgi:formate dehydrogenase subunit gamma
MRPQAPGGGSAALARATGRGLLRSLGKRLGRLPAILLFVLAVAVVIPVLAQPQPNSVNPTASSVQEQQLLRQLQQVDGRVSIPDQAAATLIQPAGRDWRAFQSGTLLWIGGIAILGMLALLIVFYAVRGKIRVEGGFSGRTIQRFNALERFAHWLTASTFVVLALSGLNVTFGRFVLLPLIGPDAFTAVSIGAKWAHNFLAFPFMVGVVLMFVLWVAHNIPNGTDVAWFKAGGGIVGHGHPPARRFNGGQKIIFWTVILGGVALSVSGLLLMFPLQYTDIAGMQLANVVHGLVGVVIIGVILAHIYIGSIGMEGAFDAMGSGQVDLNWAREHHSLWVQDEVAKGRVAPPPRGAQAAE